MSAEALLDRLRDPACYPDAPAAVEIVQTHLSVVCLAGDRVYKLKKARALPFVDFTTLDARRRTCRDEVRLNRRMCPTTYLGTSSLRPVAGGKRLRFAPIGDDEHPDDVDVAVVMRRLPADRMLDQLVQGGAVTSAELAALARLVAAFHAGADRSPVVLAAGAPQQLARFARENFPELAAIPGHGLPEGLLTSLGRAADADFARILPRLVDRAARGLVVDGHGDLHTRNVCMTDPPTVYDCIEFNPAFRCGDVATENAFLLMDLRYRRAPALAAAYEAAYIAASGDAGQRELLGPLAAYRAMVRAKVAALTAAEPELPPDDRRGARGSALRHVLLAAALTIESRGPQWLVVCGPPASGKTTLCRALAAIADWPHITTDAVRKELAGLSPTARARPEHYAAEFTARTYAEVLARAAAATSRGAPIVLVDGNFASAAQRAAAAIAGPARFVHVAIDATTAAARATLRQQDPSAISDADASVATARHAQFEPLTPCEALRSVTLDGHRPTEELVAQLLQLMLDVGH